MSDFEDTIYGMLKQAFPRATIKQQYAVKFNGKVLLFDFYIPSYGVMIECQGEQHYKFVPHFHHNKAGFDDYVYRDQLKDQWCAKNDYTLIKIPYNQRPNSAEEVVSLLCSMVDL
jgi:very-short-patch-repair endonuclease